MPECGAVEAALGIAIAKMQLAQRDALEVFERMYPGMIRDAERSEWLTKLVGAHLALEIADYHLIEAGAMLHPDGERYPSRFATAHLDSQPGTSYQPINKALLEALTRLCNFLDLWVASRDFPGLDGLINFARQAISEAEKGLGVNLGSPVPKGSDTEARGDSSKPREQALDILRNCAVSGSDLVAFENWAQRENVIDAMMEFRSGLLQTLRDIKVEASYPEARTAENARAQLKRIYILVDDVLTKAEGR